MKVFIFAGQSNAQGYANRGQLTPVPTWAQNTANGWEGHPTQSSDTGIQYAHPTLTNSPSLYIENNSGYVVDGWGPYDGCNPPFGFHAGEQSQYGPELSFLAKYRADHPTEQIAVIKVVAGGTSIADWLTGSMLPIWQAQIDQAKARFTAAGITPDWAGCLWIQGENGASSYYAYLHPTAGQEYKDQCRQLLAMFRARTATTMPIVIGGLGSQMFTPEVIGPNSSGDDTPANRLAATTNRLNQQAAVGSDPNNICYSRLDLPTLHDNANPAYWYHLTSSGVLADGERAYAAWQQVTGEVSPPPPLPLVVKFNGDVKEWLVKLNGVSVGTDGDVIDIEGAP